jgi:glycosyltransferase involved in cell wall biosynthesis
MQLIVLGMHRSGTSSVTRLLNLAGAYFGPEGMATDPNEENPKGFWERRDVRAVCDGLLHGGGYDWWKIADFAAENIPEDVRAERLEEFRRIVFQLDAHRPWVMKEPRLCLLLPILRPALEAPVIVHVIREPLEIAQSLEARNGLPIEVGLALWESYTVSAFAAAAGEPSVIVRYGELVRDPVQTVNALVDQLEGLGVQGLRQPTQREVLAFVEEDLRRQRRERPDRDGYLNAMQAALAQAGDEQRVLQPDELHVVSSGALAILRAYEVSEQRAAVDDARVKELDARVKELEGRAAQLDNERQRVETELTELGVRSERLEQELSTTARELDASRATERRLKAQATERRRAEHLATESMAVAARRVRTLRQSRAIRLSSRLSAMHELVRGRRTRGVDGAMKVVLGQINKARAALDEAGEAGRTAELGQGSDRPPPIDELRAGRRAARARGDRTKVAVLAWDVGHNPFGRAHLLADLLRDRFEVELWGAQFERYGSDIWLPLRDTDIPVRRYAGEDFPQFFATMDDAARRIDADVIFVSKPRFPALGLGILAKELWNRPLILDIDDFEPAFFAEFHGLNPRELRTRRADPDLRLPFSRLWTGACESALSGVDQITVSNRELEERYGGVIVPHARDESVFDPARVDRAAIRRRLGLRDDDRLILFGGTPRAHKGIVELLEAVEWLNDPRIKVGAYVTRELDVVRKEVGWLDRWIVPVPFQAFSELPAVLAAADLTVALQSLDHPVSRYQMPAKVTDAMAMGIPCLVTPVPPLQPLIDKDVLEVFDGDARLDERLRTFFADPEVAQDRARRAREVFRESYSYEAVRPVIAGAIEGHLDDPPPVAPSLSSLVGVARELYAPSTVSAASTAPVVVKPPPRRAVPPGSTYDLVVFWKQNDTGIYGRRQDMFLKYLARSGRFDKLVHFDHPMSAEALMLTARAGLGTSDQNRLVAQQTLRRVAHLGDRGAIRRRTFVYSAGRYSRRMKLPKRSEYVDYVRSVLERERVGVNHPVVFWMYPTSTFYPALIDELRPDIVVSDVVDDNRTWYEPGTPGYEQVNSNYADVLSRSDVVLANCEPVAESMLEFAPEVHVIANACELPESGPAAVRPPELRGLSGPIIGYAGNLSGRLDLDLLRDLARARRDWNFVFLGSTHIDRSVLVLQSEPNVRFIGTKRYERAQEIISHFDVALIPHLDNEMSRSMNPLKAYVYCSLGVPIVSSPVANLNQLSAFISVANNTDEFIAAIEASLRAGKAAPDRDALYPHSWNVRIERALELLDRAVERRRSERPQ